MPEATSQTDGAGGITQALLNALDYVQHYAAASQAGSDGRPSASAVYLQMPLGMPIEPSMYDHPWTPDMIDDAAAIDPSRAQDSAGPARLAHSMQSAMNTATLVDAMPIALLDGVAMADDRRVSVAYALILAGMAPGAATPPDPQAVARVAAAQALLYARGADGGFTGRTALYTRYVANRKAWTDAIAAQAASYWQAMADPVAGRAWLSVASSYASAVKSALDAFDSEGRAEVEAALDALASTGRDVPTALIAMARQLFEAYTLQLSGSVAAGTPWSTVDPASWWDPTDQSLGVQSLNVSSATSTRTGSVGFASAWYRQRLAAGAGAEWISFRTSAAGTAAADDRTTWVSHPDRASRVTLSAEFFVASIERSWLLGDLFRIPGWYLSGFKAMSISDGTKAQSQDRTKLLPLVCRAFVVMRNVRIEADDWGEAASTLASPGASNLAAGPFNGGAIGFLGFPGTDQASTGAATSLGHAFTRSGEGGVLTLPGSQIIGWIGEILPASPVLDSPPPVAAAAGPG